MSSANMANIERFVIDLGDSPLSIGRAHRITQQRPHVGSAHVDATKGKLVLLDVPAAFVECAFDQMDDRAELLTEELLDKVLFNMSLSPLTAKPGAGHVHKGSSGFAGADNDGVGAANGARMHHNPLRFAVLLGCVETVCKCISAGFDIDAVVGGPDSPTPLLLAVDKGHVSVVKVLVGAGASLNDSAVFGGLSALHIAARHGFLSIVQVLIDAGADVNAECGDGAFSTPLCEAVNSGHGDVAQMLFAAGAADCTSVAEDGTTLLMYAVSGGNADVVRALVTGGADVNATAEVSDTYLSSLHLATVKNHVDIVRVLVEAGATIDLPTGKGTTALYLAAERGHDDIVSILMRAGADINHTVFDDEVGRNRTPVIAATINEHVGVAMMLLAAGADW